MAYTCAYHDSMNFFGMGTGFWIQVLILLAFFGVLWWVIKGQGIQASSKSPIQILEMRLAKGEITKKEFNELKKSLTK